MIMLHQKHNIYLNPGNSKRPPTPSRSKSISGGFKKKICKPPIIGRISINGFIMILRRPYNYNKCFINIQVIFQIGFRQSVITNLKIFETSFQFPIFQYDMTISSISKNVRYKCSTLLNNFHVRYIHIQNDFIPGKIIVCYHTTHTKRLK